MGHKYFLPSYHWSLHAFHVGFCRIKLLFWKQSSLPISPVIDHASPIKLPTTRFQAFSVCPLESPIPLYFGPSASHRVCIRSEVLVEAPFGGLSFALGCLVVICAYECPSVTVPFVEKIALPQFNCFVKSQWSVLVRSCVRVLCLVPTKLRLPSSLAGSISRALCSTSGSGRVSPPTSLSRLCELVHLPV